MIQSRYVFLVLMTAFSCLFCLTSSQSIEEVYGVRWFLGEHFQFTRPGLESSEYYVIMFNSDQPLKGDLYLMVNGTRFSCSSSFLSTEAVDDHHSDVNQNASVPGDIQETYIHKCIVNNLLLIPGMQQAKTAQYQIQLEDLTIKQNVNSNLVGEEYETKILYKGVFRIPLMQDSLDVLVIGDWGIITSVGESKGYNDPTPCLKMKVEENTNLSMALFTGDLAYDFQGVHYKSMLKQIQVISSKMVFMVTPGNHDTVYHADTFELFTASFYSPLWRQFYNYFYTLQLGDIVFIEFNPQAQVFKGVYPSRMQANFSQVFREQFSPELINKLKAQYFTVAFSHYPIYCSDINDDHQSCTKNIERFESYINFFKKMELNLYFSGHVHVYERSKPVCWNGTYVNSTLSTYGFQCPIYVVEGAAGNDFYVQLEDQYPMSDFSKSLVYNTGFGILSFDVDQNNPKPSNVTYQHISSQTCDASDKFSMLSPQDQTMPPQQSDSHIFLMFIKIGIVVLGLIGIVFLAVNISKRFGEKEKKKKSKISKLSKDHVQMVEEQFQSPNVNRPEDGDLQTQ